MYVISAMLWIIAMIFLKKTEKKQNVLVAVAIYSIIYECYICMLTGLMTICHIPVTVFWVTIINVAFAAYMFYLSFRKKGRQVYYINKADAVCVFILAIVVLSVFLNRFTGDLNIIFETSDPGVHLKGAMDFVRNKSVNGMYIGQVINGLFIDSLKYFCGGVDKYKLFIIQYGINWFLAGYTFWAIFQRYVSKISSKIIVLVFTIIYMMGYPYNDMLFGFVYLQMTITVICCLVEVVQNYLGGEGNQKFNLLLMSLTCYGVGIGYTLFAPISFFAVLICIFWKEGKCERKNSFLKKENILNIVKVSLAVFLIPSLMCIWFLIIQPRLAGGVNYVSALTIEGYIYRNYYSDFVLFIVPMLIVVYKMVRGRKCNLLLTMLPLLILQCVVFTTRMVKAEVSTYYYYKLNYLFWFVLLGLAVLGVLYIFEKDRIIAVCGMLSVFGLSILHYSGFESNLNSQNVNNMPYIDSNAFFRVYDFNHSLVNRASEISQDLVNACHKINDIVGEEEVIYVGYWMDMYWFEALTDHRMPEYANFMTNGQMLESFENGMYGKYAYIAKDAELQEIQISNVEIVYEDNYGMLIKK